MARIGTADRAQLLALAEHRTVGRHEIVYRAGDPAQYLYFLEGGRVKIYHLAPGGKEVLLWFCMPGETFGLTEICHGGNRQVYARGCEPSRLLCIPRPDFKAFIERCPAAALLVIDVLSSRLRVLGQAMQSLVADDVNERVVLLLSQLASRYGRPAADGGISLTIRITHQEMADMIGASRQTVTSALNDLRRSGVVDIDDNHRIHLHPDKALVGTPDR